MKSLKGIRRRLMQLVDEKEEEIVDEREEEIPGRKARDMEERGECFGQ